MIHHETAPPTGVQILCTSAAFATRMVSLQSIFHWQSPVQEYLAVSCNCRQQTIELRPLQDRMPVHDGPRKTGSEILVTSKNTDEAVHIKIDHTREVRSGLLT
jgi:hypothetical protein